MQILIKKSNWRVLTAITLAISSCFLLSESFAKGSRMRTTSKTSPAKISPSAPIVPTATPSGGTPKAIVANLAPRKNISVSVATARSCVFTLRAAYADGASAELTNINLCKDKTVNLIEAD